MVKFSTTVVKKEVIMKYIKANWSKIFSLTESSINSNVDSDEIGNYRLAKEKKEANGLWIKYVGRTNTKRLAERLKEHLDEGYKYFRFCYKDSEEDSFLQECSDYHEFGGLEGSLDNEKHPEVPAGAKSKCPFCEGKEEDGK